MSLLVVLVCDCSFAVFYSCYLSDFIVAVLEGLDDNDDIHYAEQDFAVIKVLRLSLPVPS